MNYFIYTSHQRNSCSTSLACLFSDWTRFSWKKSYLFCVDRNPTLVSTSYLATLLWRKDDEDYFSPKLGVRIKDNNNSPHGKFHRVLFPFSSRFLDLNFASYVLYISLCYVTCHTQWACVTYVFTCLVDRLPPTPPCALVKLSPWVTTFASNTMVNNNTLSLAFILIMVGCNGTENDQW